MDGQISLASEADGGLSPISPPEEFRPLTYENIWDPKLVIPAANNIRHAGTLGWPEVVMEPVRRGKMIVVGSSPSVLEHIDDIREFGDDPANRVFVVNNAHSLLIKKHRIIPDGALLFEIEKRAYQCLEEPHPDVTYFVCSICDPWTFDQLKDNKHYVWHCWSDIWEHVKALNESFGTKKPTGQISMPLLVGGGFTTYLRSLTLGYVLGFRDFELFGFDSSYEEDEKTHFFGTPDYGGSIMPCYARTVDPTEDNPKGLKLYKSKAYLIRQADEFKQHCEAWGDRFKMRVWGRGLIPDMHRYQYPRMYSENY